MRKARRVDGLRGQKIGEGAGFDPLWLDAVSLDKSAFVIGEHTKRGVYLHQRKERRSWG